MAYGLGRPLGNNSYFFAERNLAAPVAANARRAYVMRGTNSDQDTATVPRTVWEQGVNAVGANVNLTYLTAAAALAASSTAAGDTQNLEVWGLTDQFEIVIGTTTLTGQTAANITPNLSGAQFFRALRFFNRSATNFAGNVFVYPQGTALTAGAPTDPNAVLLRCNAGRINVSRLASFTCPAGFIGEVLFSRFGAHRGAAQNAASFAFQHRPNGQVFESVQDFGADESGVQYDWTIPFRMSAGDDLEIRCTFVNQNNSVVNTAHGILLCPTG